MAAMKTRWIECAFVRGGTSKGLFFDDADLPRELPERDAIFCGALGSPDAFGRQLNGMGGGISSLSKVMAVSRSSREDVDLDYTFGQVSVDKAIVDYSANCGNLSAGVVHFALLTGLLKSEDGTHTFRLHNTNTGKLVNVRLVVVDGRAAETGDLTIPGVSGTGASIELVYPDPAGSRTGRLLPTGNPTDILTVHGRQFRASLVDAAVPLVIVAAEEIGVGGSEAPGDLDADQEVKLLLDLLRREGAVRMGLSENPETAPLSVPKIAIASEPKESILLDGTTLPADRSDLLIRMISMERAHKAVPGTGAMCIAAAAHIPGSIIAQLTSRPGAVPIRLGTPSGVVTAAAHTSESDAFIREVSLLRTARILMRGQVAVPTGDI